MFMVVMPFGGTIFVLCPQPKSVKLAITTANTIINFFMVKY